MPENENRGLGKMKRLMRDVQNYRQTVVLLTAAKEDVFDLLLEAGSLSAEELADQKNWTRRGCSIFLNSLVAIGYLEKKLQRYRIAEKYRQAFSAEKFPLLKHRLIHNWRLLNRWAHLDEVLKSGEPVTESRAEKSIDNCQNFTLSMAQGERENLGVILDAVNLEKSTHLLDLGGGPGLFSVGFAEKYSGLRVTVFDKADVEPIAREFFRQSSARDRLFFKAGDFLSDELGAGYDAALLSSILHIFSPEVNIVLLRKVFEALNGGGIIIIRDFILNRAKTRPRSAALFAVNMLVNTPQGNAYNTGEFKRWLKIAGFREVRSLKSKGHAGLIQALK